MSYLEWFVSLANLNFFFIPGTYMSSDWCMRHMMNFVAAFSLHMWKYCLKQWSLKASGMSKIFLILFFLLCYLPSLKLFIISAFWSFHILRRIFILTSFIAKIFLPRSCILMIFSLVYKILLMKFLYFCDAARKARMVRFAFYSYVALNVSPINRIAWRSMLSRFLSTFLY